MDPTLWRRLENLLDRILDAPRDDRRAELDRVCAEHPDLKARLQSLFEAHEQAGLLDSPAESLAGPLLAAGEPAAEPAGFLEGRLIGPYRLLREIGRGGMGVVYCAERADGHYDKTVALKLILTGRDTDEVRRRFLQERQILAGLEHPNIARLLDGGITEDGRPFFVMEYVEGRPITAYADENRLTVAERLGFFERVCAAVSYAQQHLVVHRDLKPSNILVTADGTVKLLDFGIAKLIGHRENEAAVTRESRPMTPHYAAPEQIRGEDVTTATDVYALGAVLYELLSGRHYLRSGGRTAGELERGILDEEPQSLDRAVTRSHAEEAGADGLSGTDIAGSRRTSLRALRRELHGDLANIVLKALRKEPRRRYTSAEALLDDLRRYRDGHTVAARRPSWTYRAGKFARRHRLGVAAAAFLVLVMAAGVTGILWQAREASRQATRATEVKEFLASLFEGADPAVSPGEELTARVLLDRGALRVDEELSGSPEIQAEIFQLIGNTYDALGHYDESAALHEKSLTLRNSVYGEDDPRFVESLLDLGEAHLRASRYDVADSLLARARVVQERRGRRDGLTARALSDMGALREGQGRVDESERYKREALAMDRQLHGPRHLDVAEDLNNLAVLLSETGHPEEAESLLTEALEIRRESLPQGHPDVAVTLHNLAHARWKSGRVDGAEALLRELIPIRRKTHPEGHPELAQSLSMLGQIVQSQGRYAEAESLFAETLRMNRLFLGDDHEAVALSINDLGVLAYRREDYETAHRHFKECLAIYEKLLPEDHPTVLIFQNNLAGTERNLGWWAEAEERYRRLLVMRKARYGARHRFVAYDLDGLGTVVREQGRAAEAVPLHREAVEIFESSDAPPLDLAYARYNLGLDLAEAGNASDAEAVLRAALAGYEAELQEDDARVGRALVALGSCLLELGRGEEAERRLSRGHEILLARYGPDHEEVRRAARKLDRSRR